MEKFVNWLKSVLGLNKPSPSNTFSKPAKTKPNPVKKPAVAKAKPAKPATPAKPSAGNKSTALPNMVNYIEKNAERFEMDQPALIAKWSKNKPLFEQAASQVDWVKVVSSYKTSVVQIVKGTGTNFNFENTPDLHHKVVKAAKKVSAARLAKAPTNHGMNAATGKQATRAGKQPRGYVRKVGAGSGMDSWVWHRKDRKPTAAEKKALKEFQAQLDKGKK